VDFGGFLAGVGTEDAPCVLDEASFPPDRGGEEQGVLGGAAVAAAQLNLLRAVNGSVQSGRFLSAVSERFLTAVIGSAAASALGFPKLTPGFTPQIVINNHWFTVIGVLRPLQLFPEINSSVLIGWDAARTQLAFTPAPTEIYLQAQQASIEAVAGVPRHDRALTPSTSSQPRLGIEVVEGGRSSPAA
jgi:hypothetical protein